MGILGLTLLGGDPQAEVTRDKRGDDSAENCKVFEIHSDSLID
jgi:hypothetical protein